jgi:hypothetical protein
MFQVYEAIVGDESADQMEDYEIGYGTDPLTECRHDLQAELNVNIIY